MGSMDLLSKDFFDCASMVEELGLLILSIVHIDLFPPN